MKAVVAAFNQEKALVGAFSVITNLRMELFEALSATDTSSHQTQRRPRVTVHDIASSRATDNCSLARPGPGHWSVPKVVCGTGGAPVAKNSVCWTEVTMVTMPGTK